MRSGKRLESAQTARFKEHVVSHVADWSDLGSFRPRLKNEGWRAARRQGVNESGQLKTTRRPHGHIANDEVDGRPGFQHVQRSGHGRRCEDGPPCPGKHGRDESTYAILVVDDKHGWTEQRDSNLRRGLTNCTATLTSRKNSRAKR